MRIAHSCRLSLTDADAHEQAGRLDDIRLYRPGQRVENARLWQRLASLQHQVDMAGQGLLGVERGGLDIFGCDNKKLNDSR